MQSARRTVAKAVTWQTLGLFVSMLVGFALTGSLATGGAMALSLSAIGAILYVAHEWVWDRIVWDARNSGISTHE